MDNNLGFGVGFRPNHYLQITEEKPSTVDWFEIVSENFMTTGGRPRQFLEKLLQNYPVVMHGVGLSIAGFDDFNKPYLNALKELSLRTNACLISDHLCWTTHSAHNSHDLLPVCFTEENLKHIVPRLNFVQESLGRQILLENPSAYVAFAKQDMSEAEFLAELSKRSGCGILLDLNNLFVNQSNLGLDPYTYLETLPKEAIKQFHLAGHTNRGDVRIDTHDQHVCDEVWELYKIAAKKWPDTPTLIEWDDKIPAFEELVAECDKARQHHAAAQNQDFTNEASNIQKNAWSNAKINIPSRDLHSNFIEMISSPYGTPDEDEKMELLAGNLPVTRDTGLDVYNQAYLLRIRDCLSETYKALYFICGEQGFTNLVARYLIAFKPSEISIKFAGANLPQFLRTCHEAADYGVSAEMLGDIAELEWKREDIFDLEDDSTPISIQALSELNQEAWNTLSFEFIGAMRLLKLSCNAHEVVSAVLNDSPPAKPTAGEFFYLVHRQDYRVYTKELSKKTFEALSLLSSGKSFQETFEALSEGDEKLIQDLVSMLPHWFELELITGIRI